MSPSKSPSLAERLCSNEAMAGPDVCKLSSCIGKASYTAIVLSWQMLPGNYRKRDCGVACPFAANESRTAP